MIRSLLLATATFLFLVSCGEQPVEEGNDELTKIIENVAAEHHWDIAHASEGSETLAISFLSHMEYAAVSGAILEDCFEALKKEDLFFDRYLIKNREGAIKLDISKENLEKALNCKQNALNAINALSAHDFPTVVSLLDSANVTNEQLAVTEKEMKNRLSGKVNEIGFEIAVQNNETYCAYVAFIDETFVNATINLSANNCSIFSLNF